MNEWKNFSNISWHGLKIKVSNEEILYSPFIHPLFTPSPLHLTGQLMISVITVFTL